MISKLLTAAVCAAFLITAARQASAQTVTLTVKADQVLRRGADKFVGLDLNYIRDADSNRKPGARPLNRALKDMGVHWLRYPGGEKSNFVLWAEPPYAKSAPVSLKWYAGIAGARLDFDAYIAHCHAVGAEPYLVAGYSTEARTGRTQAQWLENAVSWVRYANLTRKYGVKYWEIGNENWNNHTGTPEEMAKVVTQFSRAMKAVDPSIQIGASGSGDNWWSRFLPNASPALDFVSLSLYNCWQWKGYDHFIQNPHEDTIKDAENAVTAADTYAAPADRGRLKVVVAETNSKDYSDGGWPGTNTLGHALVTFDTLGQLMTQPRILAAMVWTSRWMDDSEAERSQWYALGPGSELLPTGRAIALWGRFVQAERVAVTGSTDAVTGYASRSEDGRAMSVWVLNRSLSASGTVRVALPAAAIFVKAEVWRLAGTGPDDAHPRWEQTEALPVQGGSVTLSSCPGTSVTVLSFSHSAPQPQGPKKVQKMHTNRNTNAQNVV